MFAVAIDGPAGAGKSSVAKAAAIRLPTIAIVYDPIIPLAILIAAMVLVDIAVRKIRLKDIRNFLVKLHLLSK